MRPLDLLLFVVLGAIWGASFLFIRVAAPALGPFPFMEIRVVLAAATLVVWARVAYGWRAELRHRWRAFLVQGLFNNVIPFLTIATAELTLTASLGAILNSTSPFFTVITRSVWERRAPSAGHVAGSVVGFLGVGTLVGFGPIDGTDAVIVGVILALVGAASYGVAAVFTSRAFRGVAPLDVAIGQLTASSLIMLPGALLTRTTAEPRPEVVGSVLALALVGTALAYLIYFGLIARNGPTSAISVTLLIPVFGTLFGNLFLGEPVGPGLLVGLALILAGIALVTGIFKRAAATAG